MSKQYELPEESFDNAQEPVAMVSESISIPMTNVQTEQLEALWTLIKSQGKQVQKTLLDRLNSLFQNGKVEVETAQHLYVKESLHRAFENMREAEASGVKEQTLDEFLDEL